MYNGAGGYQRTILLGAVLLCLFVVQTAALAMTPAGTQIHNRAEATYAWQGQTLKTMSERITVTVLQVAAAELSPASVGQPGGAAFAPAYTIAAPAENRLYIPFRLENKGNGPDTFQLTALFEVDPVAPALQDLSIYHDVDEDGVPSSGDKVISEITIAPGKSAALLLSLKVPPGAADGTDYYARIHARSKFDANVVADDGRAHIKVENAGGHLFVHRTVSVDPAPAFSGADGQQGVVASEGATLTHVITLTNISLTRVDDVVVWEPLSDAEQLLEDAYGTGAGVLLNGAPTAVGGPGGAPIRQITDASGTRGLEIDISRIQPDHRMQIEYKTTVEWKDSAAFVKQTEARYDTVPGQLAKAKSNDIRIITEGAYSLEIGPKGSVPAPGEKPVAAKDPAYYGEVIRFPTVLHHTGSLPGAIDLGLAEPLPPGWTVRFFEADGVTPLRDTNGNGLIDTGIMQPGSSREIVVQITPPSDPDLAPEDEYEFEVIASFTEDSSATGTTSIVLRVMSLQTPVDVWEPLLLLSDAGPAVTPGQEITFAVLFGNNSGVDVYDATLVVDVADFLDRVDIAATDVGNTRWILDAVDADSSAAWQDLGLTTADGVFDPVAGTITWQFVHLAPDMGGKVVFKGRVPAASQGGTPITVQGVLKGDSPTHEEETNVVRHTVLGDALDIQISAGSAAVTPGDAVRYTATVTNLNTHDDFEDVEVWIELPEGLTFRTGTSTLNGQPVGDPDIVDGKLRYVIPHLPKGGRADIGFSALVNALAEGELVVAAQARFQSRANVWFESRTATVSKAVRGGMFADDGIVVGRVGVDGGRPGAGIRVLLDDGRYAVTDAQGYYTLLNVEPGPRLLRLDPAALQEVEEFAGGIDGGELRFVRIVVPRGGLAVVDFALQTNVIGVETEERGLEGKDR